MLATQRGTDPGVSTSRPRERKEAAPCPKAMLYRPGFFPCYHASAAQVAPSEPKVRRPCSLFASGRAVRVDRAGRRWQRRRSGRHRLCSQLLLWQDRLLLGQLLRVDGPSGRFPSPVHEQYMPDERGRPVFHVLRCADVAVAAALTRANGADVLLLRTALQSRQGAAALRDRGRVVRRNGRGPEEPGPARRPQRHMAHGGEPVRRGAGDAVGLGVGRGDAHPSQRPRLRLPDLAGEPCPSQVTPPRRANTNTTLSLSFHSSPLRRSAATRAVRSSCA